MSNDNLSPLVFSTGERWDLIHGLRDAIKGHEAALKGIERRGGTNAATREAKARHEAEIIDLDVLRTRIIKSLAPVHPTQSVTITRLDEEEDTPFQSQQHFNAGHRPGDCDDRCADMIARHAAAAPFTVVGEWKDED